MVCYNRLEISRRFFLVSQEYMMVLVWLTHSTIREFHYALDYFRLIDIK